WVLDFLLFDRAAAQYSGDDLTRFLAGYTALLNLADILFLALLAGPLMRRFGLRLGLVLNPAVVALILAIMTVVVAGPGAASFGLFVLAGLLRIADIVTTDGTTRTSINAAYQMVPVEERLAVQSVVEGIGVPLAIGLTGVLLLALNLLGLGVGAVVVFGLVLGVIWTVLAVVLYRSYTRTLGEEMRRRSFGSSTDVAEDDAVRTLLRSDDVRDVRLGLDLLAGAAAPPPVADLLHVSEHADPELRMSALLQLAEAGDERTGAEVAALVDELARSASASERRAAARALGSRDVVAGQPERLVALLDDPDPSVRAAALAAVAPEDSSDPEIVRLVVAAVGEPRTAGPATAALRALGAAPVPLIRDALARADARTTASLVRAAAVAAAEHGFVVIEPALGHADRDHVLSALDALDAAGGAGTVPPAALEEIARDATAHAHRALAARTALAGRDGSLQRALEDEVDLVRALIIAVLSLRHGTGVREAVRVVDHAHGQRQALGIEALDVLLSRDEASLAIPLVRRDLEAVERAVSNSGVERRTPEEWLADIAHDPSRAWRSPWLAACARHALEA
ncbi:MAG TPA: hypothetical protein VK896_14750, partial [Gaiellaceae bacterium]|nr:hypothetical protein [Gaiellaceae bacterium]